MIANLFTRATQVNRHTGGLGKTAAGTALEISVNCHTGGLEKNNTI